MSESLKVVNEYRNTREGNNKIWRDVTKRVDDLPTLKDHRDFVEEHGWVLGVSKISWLLVTTEYTGKYNNYLGLRGSNRSTLKNSCCIATKIDFTSAIGRDKLPPQFKFDGRVVSALGSGSRGQNPFNPLLAGCTLSDTSWLVGCSDVRNYLLSVAHYGFPLRCNVVLEIL